MDAAPDDSMPPRATSLRRTVPADPTQLGDLRSSVVEFATVGGADDDVVAALELAVSELATNVIQHTDAEVVTVAVERDDDTWRLEVSEADRLTPLTTPRLPDPSALSGRGLFLVRSVMDAVEIVEIDGRRHVRCVKRG